MGVLAGIAGHHTIVAPVVVDLLCFGTDVNFN